MYKERTGFTLIELLVVIAINRHQGAVNALFMDGHVAPVKLKGLWELNWQQGYNRTGPRTVACGAQDGDWPEWMRNL